MAFAYRSRDALFELNPGESQTWRLPPMTPGHIVLSSFYAMPPDWSAGTIERSSPARGSRGVGVGGPIGELVVGTAEEEDTVARERDESIVPVDDLRVRD